MEFPTNLIDALRGARHVVALTGAGVSAESGLQTFRDALTGLWAQYRAEDLATENAFRRNPKLVWDWYGWRRERAAQAEPNAGHRALAAMAALVPTFTLITQNVDGLHQRAGSVGVIELHGSIHRCKCLDAGHIAEAWSYAGDDVPRCVRCGSYLRPDVVWFGENLPRVALAAAADAAQHCDVFFSIGTSGQVQPAASLLGLAARSGAFTCVVNKDASGFPEAACVVEAASGEALPSLVKKVWDL